MPVVTSRVINVTVSPITKTINVTLKSPNEAPKPVVVQPNTTRGPQGESPYISVYNAAAITSINNVLTIDASTASSNYVVLTQDITDIIIINWPPAAKTQRIAIYFQQDNTGNRIIHKWPNNTKWSNGVAPQMSTHSNAIDCVIFDTFDHGNTIFGSFVGQDYS